MKRSLIPLSLFASLAFFASGCNEKISPALEGANSSTTVPGSVVPPEYYFKLVNNNPTVLNYVLHRTGPGNAATPCKVSDDSALSSSKFVGEGNNPLIAHDKKKYDITCFMEAEELSLQFNGLDISLEASQNTCKYIGYQPFSFWMAKAGRTAADFISIVCDGDKITSVAAKAYIAATVSGAYPELEAVNNFTTQASVWPGCNQMVDVSAPDKSNRLLISSAAKSSYLCAYDYSDNTSGFKENCDIGEYNISTITLTDSDNDGAIDSFEYEPAPEGTAIKCGGKVSNCVKGPIRKIHQKGTFFTETTNTNPDEKFSKTWTIPKIDTNFHSTIQITNFRRGLANPNIQFGNYSSANNGKWSKASAGANFNIFDPKLMEAYASNRDYAPAGVGPTTRLVEDAEILAASFPYGFTAYPYSADPFLSVHDYITGEKSKVSPFYTFYCIDNAEEVLSRIRLVVRDWDRVFPSASSYLEQLSDRYLGSDARQDLPYESEIGDEVGWFNYYNDRDDWDNYVYMDRTPGPAATAVWKPTSGFFNDNIFPRMGDQPD